MTKGEVMTQISLFDLKNTSGESVSSAKARQKTQILYALEDCHNYIYANEGILKEKAFREIIKVLFLKTYAEKYKKDLFFKITKKEYNDIFKNKPCNSFDERIKKNYQIFFNKSPLKIRIEKPLLGKKSLAYVVNRLQSVCLNNTSTDMAGQAFQTFIHHHQRGERGEFFTPSPIVKMAVQIIQPKYYERLIDPACGSGGFLLSSIRYIEKTNLHKKISLYVKNNIYGIEFNPDVAWSAKLLLETEGGKESNIICANSLSTENQHNSFDIVLTNPPFGRKGKVEDPTILKKYDLGKKWYKTKSNTWYKNNAILSPQSPEVLFIEKCLNLLKPEGRMAIVLPDGLLQNPSLSFVRHWIRGKACIIGVISLPQETFMPFGTGVKTSLLILKKTSQRESVFFSKIKSVKYHVQTSTNEQKYPDSNQITNSTFQNHSQCHKNNDIDQAVNLFHSKQREYKPNSIAWRLKPNLLKDRWDAEHYSLQDMQMIEKLNPKRVLANFVKIVREKENFHLYATSSIIKYVAISDIDQHGMKIVSHQELPPAKLPSRASYKIQVGDILMAVSGANTGTKKQAVALVTKEYSGSICSNGFAVLRNIKDIDKYFLLAFLKTDIFIKQVRRMMTGHAIPFISLGQLGQIMVPFPNQQIQNQIAKRTKQIIALSQKQQTEINKLQKELQLI